jgi:hypothetical protein
MRVLLYDATDKLTPLWAAGRHLSRWDAVIAARSWAHAIDTLQALPDPVRRLQFWGHGMEGSPLIAGERLGGKLQALVDACDFAPRATVWWRACDVFGGEAGHRFAVRFCEVAGIGHAGHTRVISAPWPMCQSGGHALRPGKRPHWPADEGDRDGNGSAPWKPNTCLVSQMRIPRRWWTS